MKKIYLLICYLMFAAFGMAQTNVEKSLESIRKSGNLVKSIRYNSDNENDDYTMEESAIYYIKNNEEQINDFLQAIKKDNHTASMALQSTKEGNLKSKTLIFRSNGKQLIYMIEMADSVNAEISYIKSKFIENEVNIFQSSQKNTNKVKYLIPKGGYMTVDGKKVNAVQARELGLDVEEE